MPVVITRHSRRMVVVLPALLVLIASFITWYKVAAMGYTLDNVLESETYYLETVMEFDGHGTDIEISMALPQNQSSQVIYDEAFVSDDTRFSVANRQGNRRGTWRGSAMSGAHQVGYTATIKTSRREFVIDSMLPTVQSVPSALSRYLMADTAIQCDHPSVSTLSDSLGLSIDSTILWNLQTVYEYATFGLRYVRYSGTTDALTAHSLGEASCGGKSRLAVALLRNLGVPARLVGGKILNAGESKATHIWVEAWLHGVWVPFCPTNKYFAVMPDNYLILYYGEAPVITHTKDINFKYYFNVKKRLVANPMQVRTAGNILDSFNIWTTFHRVSISLELLKIIIMLPVGILAVVFFRNVIGIETFGTFMPTLIAIGFRETGLLIGLVLFTMIMLFGSVVRLGLNRLQLLHTPRLAILLSAIVLFLLTVMALGVDTGFLDAARVALFPMVILTMTVERYAVVVEEYGFKRALVMSGGTVLVSAVAYGLMSSRILQSLVITFPESILLMIAIHLYLGRYSGFRLKELLRFRQLLFRG